MDACLHLLCLFQFFSTKPRDWLGILSQSIQYLNVTEEQEEEDHL